MNGPHPLPPRFWLRPWHVLLLVFVGGPVLFAIGISSYFRLGSDTAALRTSVMKAVPGQWDKRVTVNVGGFTLAALRFGAKWFEIPPEGRAGINTVRGAEVGVYRLSEHDVVRGRDTSAVLPAADKAMRARGWERMVGVVEGRQIVGIYVPAKGISARRISCCVMVLQDRDLVVVRARGCPQPLLDLAQKHLHEAMPQALECWSRKPVRTRVNIDNSAGPSRTVTRQEPYGVAARDAVNF